VLALLGRRDGDRGQAGEDATNRRIDGTTMVRRVASMQPYTDIVSGGWVARLPRGWIPYAILARLDRPIGAWLLFLPGLWSILLARVPAGRSAWLIALFFVGAFVMRAAGCVVNDIWDRELDRLVTRTAGRPLAAGTLRLHQAIWFLAGLLGVGFLIVLLLPRIAQELGVVSLLLVAFYPLAKRVTWWPQLMLGFTFGWGAPMGYAASALHLDGAAVALYAAAIMWILGYDTIYAHQDREDDALVGVRSTARLFEARTRPFLAACYVAMLLLLALAGFRAGLSFLFDLALLLPAGLLAWQVTAIDIDDPRQCLRLFKLNREVGLAVGLAIILGRM
jgi:4-hydroxybenzoate polyprenyltransferase